jgi:sulfur-carrier protein adenylyltransferase/sulfurtransferase
VEPLLTPDELTRYSRHLVLPGFGVQAQEKLKRARIAVIGAGGLGAPVLFYLAAAGIGEITVFDSDIVSLSNLQRQILFTQDDIGKSKASAAVHRLKILNSTITVNAMTERITSANALHQLQGSHIIIDCTDNFPSRYLLNDAAVLLGIPLVYGSVFQNEGQVAVFNFRNGPNYRDLHPVPPAVGSVPDCEEGGVLGVLPGIIGSMQANEALKILTGMGDPLAGRLLLYDSRTCESTVFHVPNQNQKMHIHSLIDYDDFCGISQKKKENWSMKEITVQELKKLMDSKADFQLIDVREPHEYELCNLDGELIPMAEVPMNTDRIAKDKKVIMHCRSGKRSGDMILWLEKNQGFDNLFNLKGGILAWAKEIDTTMPTY